MARDISPIVKQSRREGYALAPKAHKVMAKKSGIPGEHADMRIRGGSLYLTQLREKQKVRRLYGLLEKQFAKLMKEAARADGLAGENLLSVAPITPFIALALLLPVAKLVSWFLMVTSLSMVSASTFHLSAYNQVMCLRYVQNLRNLSISKI